DDVPGALDYEDLNYYTALPGKWRTTDDPALTHDGEDALVSSRTSEGESVFKVYVGGEGELSFWMKASDAAAGHISISCAGAALLSAEASDYAEWTHLTLPVEGDGLHTVSITYTREEDAVDDFMIIDEMAWSSQTVYTVEFDGGEHGTITGNASQLVVYGASAEAPEVEGDKGWEFDGFDTDFSSVTGNLKVTAQWRRKTFTVVFVSQGKRVRTIKRPFESAVGAVPSASREGWEFVGWVATLEDGSSVTVDAATEVLEDMTAVAQWRAREFTITFDPNGGTGGGTKITMTGTAVGSASALKQGYVLEGWYTAAEGGQYVAPYTLALADATYYAHWRKLGGGDSEEIDDGEDEGGEGDGGEGSESGSNEGEGEGASGNGGGSGVDEGGAVEEEPVDEDEDLEGLDTSKASVFNGYLASADGKPAGTIVLKVGKAAKRTGMSAVTATIQVAGVAKKTVLKDSVAFTADAPTEVAIGELKLAVAADSFKGKYGTLAAMGVKTQDASAYAAWKGKTYAAVIGREGTSGFTLVSMKIGARGKVKVKAVLPTGKTATGSAQLLPGADAAAIPVTLAKANVAFVLKIADGDVAADGVAASGEPETASASTAGIGLPSSFAVDGLKVSGLRISVQKATGFIKGSFTVAVASQKVKFTLNGVVIDDVLYLNAYNKITGVLALAVDGEE
ncbi:MAG: InlB B-repeat-containing protein, partial [Kiritimatiellae bacterium]|nr:InlB B-repeat-containing protein [Kiritimatiellia bacterium]